ncbi:hypothetical protein [Paraburkholderia fungorum]|uniref:hypothetical protein n=1 Tax=Paraburkholderia fungorum TaxID=134537 RepID=UPI003877D1FD
MSLHAALREPVIGIQHHFQIDVFGHPFDQPMRLGQARTTAKNELNVPMLKFRQRMQGVSDVDIFLENEGREVSGQPFRGNRINKLFLFF